MQIAVDARPLQADAALEYGDFTREIILWLAKTYPLHQFILLADNNVDPLMDFPENVSQVILTPKPTHFLLYKWWYDVKVPLALKKYKADVFICTQGICSLATSVPQILVIKDFTFLHYPEFFSKQDLSFYKQYTSRFLKKAALVATLSDFIKKEIINTYKIQGEKIKVVGAAANDSFYPLQWEEREHVKEKYVQGCECFVFPGGLNPVQNLLNILKAFSIFKKWQRTNMKLVVILKKGEYKDQVEKLNLYKFKSEVFFAEDLTAKEFAKVIAAAYAMIFNPLYEGSGAVILEAMQCEVPVITSINSSMTELAGDAALYANPENPQEIAEQMKLIFKDEQLRSKLILAGKERAKEFSWDKTVALVWQIIGQVVSR